MELLIGSNLLLQPTLKALCQKYGSKNVLIADEALFDLYAKNLADFLNADLYLISNKKDLETFLKLQNQLLEKSYGKDTVFLALGGGSITDLAGFLASIFLRGVPLIHLPTTLLAMVDAAIGGKTAIDTPFGKNQIGTFYPPKAVVADLNTLKTLPEKEWINGRSEIIKMGLIYDPSILEDFSLEKAMQAKLKIVEKDPFENGLRRILNFGHTIGHAIETLCKISHGEAVAIGCVAESHLSYRLGYLSKSNFERICKVQPLKKMTFDKDLFFQILARDKKKINHQIRSVLIDSIGHAIEFGGAYCRVIEKQAFLETLEFIHG